MSNSQSLLALSQRWLCKFSPKPSSLANIFKVSISTMASTLNGNMIMASKPQRAYQVVVAATKEMGIGKDGKLPWNLPTDLKFFKDLTLTTLDSAKKNALVMGRKTWESIPTKYRPLSGRLNIVLTRSSGFYIANTENVVTCSSIDSALDLLAAPPYSLSIEKVFVIGGGEILRFVFFPQDSLFFL